jgi:hypothetical protein
MNTGKNQRLSEVCHQRMIILPIVFFIFSVKIENKIFRHFFLSSDLVSHTEITNKSLSSDDENCCHNKRN